MFSEKLGRILRVTILTANYADGRGFGQVDCNGS